MDDSVFMQDNAPIHQAKAARIKIIHDYHTLIAINFAKYYTHLAYLTNSPEVISNLVTDAPIYLTVSIQAVVQKDY